CSHFKLAPSPRTRFVHRELPTTHYFSQPLVFPPPAPTLRHSWGRHGFDVGDETPGACRVVGTSLNCLQTYSCQQRQLRSGGLIPPNLRLACACASRFGGRAHKLAIPVCLRLVR